MILEFRKKKFLEGFTLLELLLVVVIIAAVVGISIPRFTKSHAHKLVQSESKKLESFLRYVQNRSRVNRKNYKVIINPEDNKYWYEVKKDGKTKVSKKYKLPQKLNLKNNGDEKIWFYPDMRTSGKLSLLLVSPRYDYKFSIKKEKGVSKIRVKESK